LVGTSREITGKIIVPLRAIVSGENNDVLKLHRVRFSTLKFHRCWQRDWQFKNVKRKNNKGEVAAFIMNSADIATFTARVR
jgi:hypothetical protein